MMILEVHVNPLAVTSDTAVTRVRWVNLVKIIKVKWGNVTEVFLFDSKGVQT